MSRLISCFTVLLVVAAAGLSCAPHTAGVLLDISATTPARLRELMVERDARLHSLQGSGDLSFDSPEISGDAAFSSRLKRPDSLLVFLEGPFGIDVGTLFLSRARYVVYNGLQNKVVTGDPADGAFRSLIPFDLTYEQLLNAFAGVFLPPAGEPAVYDVRDDALFLSYPCGATTCEYWVDPSTLLVTRFRTLDAGGGVFMDVRCSSPEEDDGAAAPRRIVVSFPETRRRLSIAYSRVSLNDPDLSFEYAIPDNAQTIVR